MIRLCAKFGKLRRASFGMETSQLQMTSLLDIIQLLSLKTKKLLTQEAHYKSTTVYYLVSL